MHGEKCAEAVRKRLEGIANVEIDVPLGRVVVETSLPWSEIQDTIEQTGKKAVLSGFGGTSAVAIVDEGNDRIRGVIRFCPSNNGCVVDGVIDGLDPGTHRINIHECGDISNGCASVGDVYKTQNSSSNNINSDGSGRATFRFLEEAIDVGDIIGRSVVITSKEQRLACGIVARSAGIFQNYKKICACDGLTLWDERDRSLTGVNGKKPAQSNDIQSSL